MAVEVTLGAEVKAETPRALFDLRSLRAVVAPNVGYAATGDGHALKERLDTMLAREGRTELAQACFGFLPHRVRLDLAGWAAEDIFAHS